MYVSMYVWTCIYVNIHMTETQLDTSSFSQEMVCQARFFSMYTHSKSRK
jgi:hypothetical protein